MLSQQKKYSRFAKDNPFIIPLLIFAVFIFLGARAHPLWTDEAETALFARNIVQFGLPTGWDGVNLISVNNGVLLNRELLNHTSPWAQFYLSAISFKLLGESSFTARLPFVLISLGIIPLIYFLTKAITKDDEGNRIAFLTALAASFSVPMILYLYNARYYSLTIFFGLLFFYSALFLDAKKIWPKIGFTISGIGFIYSFYLSLPVFYLAVFFGITLHKFLRGEEKSQIIKYLCIYLGLGIIILASFLPWYLILSPESSRVSLTVETLRQFWRIPEAVKTLLALYNLSNIFPLPFFGFLGLSFYLSKKFSHSNNIDALLLSSVACFYILILAILTSFSKVIDTNPTELRYNLVLFPLLIMLSVMLISKVFKFNKYLFWLAFIIYTLTNLWTLQKPIFFVLEYIQEVFARYPTPDKIVADYLKKNAKDGDTVFVNYDRNHDPLMFELGNKIKLVNRITPERAAYFSGKDGQMILPTYIYAFAFEPDWIIFYGKRGKDGSWFTFDYRGRFPRGISPAVDLKNHYRETIIPTLFVDLTRPEMYLHRFDETRDMDLVNQVFIYQKI